MAYGGRSTDQPKRQEESMSISISSRQQIQHRAYEIFLERRHTGRKGDALSDWLEAEQEIRRGCLPLPARMPHVHFAPAELPPNLSGLRPPPPHLARIHESIRQPA
jgi:hypothetical protein